MVKLCAKKVRGVKKKLCVTKENNKVAKAACQKLQAVYKLQLIAARLRQQAGLPQSFVWRMAQFNGAAVRHYHCASRGHA